MSQFQENLQTDERTDRRTDGRMDGQTLFYRTLPVKTGGPKKCFCQTTVIGSWKLVLDKSNSTYITIAQSTWTMPC